MAYPASTGSGNIRPNNPLTVSTNMTLDVANRKVVTGAFLNVSRNDLSITATCRHRFQTQSGNWVDCTHLLEQGKVMQALDLVGVLHTFISHDIGVETDRIFNHEPLQTQLLAISRCLLCEEHFNSAATINLAGVYLRAIHATAVYEVNNGMAVNSKLVQTNVLRIEQDFRIRAGAVRSAQRAPASGNPRGTKRPPSMDQAYGPRSAEYLNKKAAPQQTGPQQTGPQQKVPQPMGPQQMNQQGQEMPATPRPRPVNPVRDQNIPQPFTPILEFIECLPIHNEPHNSVAINTYIQTWAEIDNGTIQIDKEKSIAEQVPYPTYSKLSKHVSEHNCCHFYFSACEKQTDIMAFLRKERLRWHPDKLDQRFNGHVGLAELKTFANEIISHLKGVTDTERDDLNRKNLFGLFY